jgi:hypothetical protein
MKEAEQLHLFVHEAQAAIGDARGLVDITWSHSRRALLEKCPLQFYYEYYGSNVGTATNDPDKLALHFLKCLENRYTRAGALLHLVISTFFRRAQKGEVWGSIRLQDWAGDMLDRDVSTSASNPDGDAFVFDSQSPALLREFYYREPGARQYYREIRARLLRAIGTFRDHPTFDWCRAVGMDPTALIEVHATISNLPCSMDGRVDLAHKGESGINIVDWKLGGTDSGDDSLQLCAYALWACERFSCGPSDVHIYKAFLGSATLIEFPVSERILRSARARIIQDALTMKLLDSYARAGRSAAFTACAQRKVCGMCSYQRVCPIGRELSSAGDIAANHGAGDTALRSH